MVHFPPRYQLSSDQSRSAVAPVCFPRKFMARWGKIVRIDALHAPAALEYITLPCGYYAAWIWPEGPTKQRKWLLHLAPCIHFPPLKWEGFDKYLPPLPSIK